jgi:hypothetical protein
VGAERLWVGQSQATMQCPFQHGRAVVCELPCTLYVGGCVEACSRGSTAPSAQLVPPLVAVHNPIRWPVSRATHRTYLQFEVQVNQVLVCQGLQHILHSPLLALHISRDACQEI